MLARVAKQVRPALGDELWADFVAHAEARYKQALVPSASQAFTVWGRRTAADARAPSAST